MATKPGQQAAGGEAKSSAAAGEPTDADLMTILQTGAAPAANGKKAATPEGEVIEDDDDDPEKEEGAENLDDEESGGVRKAKAQKTAADSGLEDDEPEAEAGDEETVGEETGEVDGEAKVGDDAAELDEEDQKVRAKFTPEQQARFDKAVQKKTRRILDLREQLEEEKQLRTAAENERDEVRKNPPTASAATADNPLAGVEDEGKLDEELGKARKVRRFALANPDGAYVDTKTGAVVALELEEGEKPPEGIAHFSKRRIGEILADTEELLQEHGPKRRKFLQDRTAAEAAAVQEFPALKNKASQVALEVEAQLRRTPALRAVVGIQLILADAFIGRHARAKAKAAALAAKSGGGQTGAGDSRKAPPSPGGGTRPGKISGREKFAGAAMQTVAKTGDDPDNAGLQAILNS